MTRHHLICDVTCDMCYVTCVFLISKKNDAATFTFCFIAARGSERERQ